MNFLINFFKNFGFKKDEKNKIQNQLLKKIDFKKLETQLGVKIKNKNIFVTSLTHRSYLKYHYPQIESNERLEFFGDAVVNLVAGKFLFNYFPKASEGELTHFRSHLVSKTQLSVFAEKINLWEFLLKTDFVDLTSTSKGGKTILADAFEAIVGAIYFDSGAEVSEKFLIKYFEEELISGSLSSKGKNPKSALLEYLQAERKDIPRYAVVKQEGPGHDSDFTVAVFINGIEIARGIGKNKKEAEQIAAAEALKIILKK